MHVHIAGLLCLFGATSVAASPTGVAPFRNHHHHHHHQQQQQQLEVLPRSSRPAAGSLPVGPPWPELGATPIMAYNGWLASTEFMGYNNETLYYKLVDQLVASNLSAAGYTTIVRRSISLYPGTQSALDLPEIYSGFDGCAGSDLQRVDSRQHYRTSHRASRNVAERLQSYGRLRPLARSEDWCDQCSTNAGWCRTHATVILISPQCAMQVHTPTPEGQTAA